MPTAEERKSIVELFGEDLSDLEILIIWATWQRFPELGLADLIAVIKCGMVITEHRIDHKNALRLAYNS